MNGTLDDLGSSVLFVHAHPDDESISTGGTIAAVMRSGGRAFLLTATRGERGEVMAKDLAHLEGTPALVAVRERELANALAELGGPGHAFLGSAPARAAGVPERRYTDSGMQWGPEGLAIPASSTDSAAFSRAPWPEVLADGLALANQYQPTSVVGYDERGGYGHPDHVRAHALAAAIAGERGVPFYAIMESRVDPPGGKPLTANLTVSIGELFDRKAQAMAAHRTQLAVDGGMFTLSGGQIHPIGREERFRLIG